MMAIDVTSIRPATLSDLDAVVSWLGDETDCTRWAGSRVAFPVDRAELPRAIEWEASQSWSVTIHGGVVAFGQLVPKAAGRLHLARLLAMPERQGVGIGRRLATHMLDAALAVSASVISLNVAADEGRGDEETMMCRNIETLYNFEPPASEFESSFSSRLASDFILATYEGWQRNALASKPPDNGRIASVLFRGVRPLD